MKGNEMLRLLADEHISWPLITGLQARLPGLEVVRVQDIGLGETDDREILAWAAEKVASPRRMIAIQTNMGILPMYFWPEGTGKSYKASPYLETLKDFRDDLSVFSGVSHPQVDGGHQAEQSFLTAAPHPGSGAFKNSVSLDQVAAEQLGALTRFGALATRIGNENGSLSYTRGGVMIPAERSPSALFRKLFVQGT